jgi:hypothetical protein
MAHTINLLLESKANDTTSKSWEEFATKLAYKAMKKCGFKEDEIITNRHITAVINILRFSATISFCLNTKTINIYNIKPIIQECNNIIKPLSIFIV